MANRGTPESLIPMVENLAELFSVPALEGKTDEIKRRQVLKSNSPVIKGSVRPSRQVSRKLDKALRDLEPLTERGKVTGFLNNVKDAMVFTGLADGIRDAIMDYQVRVREASV